MGVGHREGETDGAALQAEKLVPEWAQRSFGKLQEGQPSGAGEWKWVKTHLEGPLLHAHTCAGNEAPLQTVRQGGH